MGYKIYCCILILIILTPFSSLAEHDCLEEGWKEGHWIEVKKNLPKNWLMIGDELIYDPQLHSILRSKFATAVIIGVVISQNGITVRYQQPVPDWPYSGWTRSGFTFICVQ